MDSASSTCLPTARWYIAAIRSTLALGTRNRARRDWLTSASTSPSRAPSDARLGISSTAWRAWEATSTPTPTRRARYIMPPS